MKRILITGISGMIGTALSKQLERSGYEVSGISRDSSIARDRGLHHYLGDILDVSFLKKVMLDYQPHVVFHLAAQAFNGSSWDKEDTTYLINIQGSRNVFEACRDYTNARVIPACSSAEYGIVDKQPISEDEPLRPITPYGVSKACMEMMGRQFSLNYNMDFVFPRLFIHVGTGHPPATLIQNLAKQYASCASSGINRVFAGNLSTKRDYVDVEDGVRALELIMESGGRNEVYNVCSRKGYSGHDVVKILNRISGIDPVIVESNNLLRPSDEASLIGSPYNINKLGWSASIPFEDTIEKVYNDWRERL
jgi:GDP-4-dehydro-6-deoxy-D-mannose reductase